MALPGVFTPTPDAEILKENSVQILVQKCLKIIFLKFPMFRCKYMHQQLILRYKQVIQCSFEKKNRCYWSQPELSRSFL